MSEKSSAMVAEIRDKLWEMQEEFSKVEPLPPVPPSLPVSPEKPQEQKRFKWATNLDNLPAFSSKTAFPVIDIRKVVWTKDNMKAIHRSSEGSLGVYFVQFKDDSCSVIKAATNSLVSEMFCNLLSQTLGIRAPKMLLVRTSTTEGVQLLEALKHVDPTWAVVARLFDQAYLYHMEYIKGTSVGGKDGIDEILRCEEEFSKFLKSVGAIMALDVFVNNGDRLPLIWDNQGNAGNVYLSLSKGKVRDLINLDMQVTAIDVNTYKKEFEAYKETVVTFLNDLRLLKDKPNDKQNNSYKKVEHVLRFISKWTGTEIPLDKSVPIVVDGFMEIHKQFPGTRVKELLEKCKKLFGDLEKETPNLVNTSVLTNGFIDEMLRVFSAKF